MEYIALSYVSRHLKKWSKAGYIDPILPYNSMLAIYWAQS